MVAVAEQSAWIQISGRANFTASVDFKALVAELHRTGHQRFELDLTECVLMDSTFLGILAQFGMKMNQAAKPGERGIELLNANPRITELLENLGALHLFTSTTGATPCPDDAKPCTPAPVNPTHQEITRTCLEAHETLMSMNQENTQRFKDVTRFLAEDLKNLEKGS
jgi:anti-anti-sigma regulatory factor